MNPRAIAASRPASRPRSTPRSASSPARCSRSTAPEILGWLATNPRPAVGTRLWFGGLIELGCGSLIALGLFTRAAAFLAAGTMAVAYFQFHWKLAVANFAWLPMVNRDCAALYCFVFLLVMTRGPGYVSLDSALRRR